jgi:holin-like protein
MGESWRVRLATGGQILAGGLILGACYLAGNAIKAALSLIIPSGIVGLFLLLALLGVGVVRLAWVEKAAALFLWLLPLWLLPVFVSVAEDKHFWRDEGPLFLGTVVLGLLILWAFVGHLAQWLFARLPGDPLEPGPLTDAEQRRAAADVAEEEVAP